MRDHERLAGSLPFLVSGSLDDDDRRALELHLQDCGECRERLVDIRKFAELAQGSTLQRALEHVAPSLLVEYAEQPDALDAETKLFIEQRLERCSTCRDALQQLQLLDAKPTSAEPSGLWAWLSQTLLQPAPALAYLAIAALGWTFFWFQTSPDGPLLPAQSLRLESEQTLRSSAETTAVTPFVVAFDRDRPAPLSVELLTELTEEDLGSPGLSFQVELSRNGITIWSIDREPAAFLFRDDFAVLPVILEPARMTPGSTYRLTLRTRLPGDPLDGQALFARDLRFESQ